MLTRVGGAWGGKFAKFVVCSSRSTFPVKLNGSTKTLLKCNVSNKVPSRMNPFNGATHPSPIVCSQFKSISVSST